LAAGFFFEQIAVSHRKPPNNIQWQWNLFIAFFSLIASEFQKIDNLNPEGME